MQGSPHLSGSQCWTERSHPGLLAGSASPQGLNTSLSTGLGSAGRVWSCSSESVSRHEPWGGGQEMTPGPSKPSSQAPGGFLALLPSPVPGKGCCDHLDMKNTFGSCRAPAAVGPESASLGLSLGNVLADLLRRPACDGDSAAAWVSLFITLTGG